MENLLFLGVPILKHFRVEHSPKYWPIGQHCQTVQFEKNETLMRIPVGLSQYAG